MRKNSSMASLAANKTPKVMNMTASETGELDTLLEQLDAKGKAKSPQRIVSDSIVSQN